MRPVLSLYILRTSIAAIADTRVLTRTLLSFGAACMDRLADNLKRRTSHRPLN